MGVSFKFLEKYLESSNMNLVLTKNGDKICVSILPKPKINDEAKSNLKPIVIKGIAEELDEQFHIVLQKPLEKVTGIINNIAEFEKNAELMAEKSKIAESEKKKVEANKKKAEKKVEKAKEYLEKEEFDKAMYTVKEAIELAPKLSSAINLKDEIEENKKSKQQVDIFSVIDESEKEQKEEKPTITEPTQNNEMSAMQEMEEELWARKEFENSNNNNNETINFC